MKRCDFDAMKCIVVLAMLTPAVALANSHGGYSFATVTPTTVAPGDYITVEFEYTTTVTDGSPTSLWAILFGGVSGQVPYDSAGVVVAEDLPSTPVNGTYTFTLSGSNAVVVQIPDTAEAGQYPINIFSCAASYQPVSAYKWYVEQPSGLPIMITVEVEEQDILDFFDASAADGTLVGRGAIPAVAEFRLNLMRTLLEAADFLVSEGQPDLARFFLELAYDFTDGQPQPLDLVVGDGTPELAIRIQALIDGL